MEHSILRCGADIHFCNAEIRGIEPAVGHAGQLTGKRPLWDIHGMLGWHIAVYRQVTGGSAPATTESAQGTRLAVWQTGLGGLEWLDELVKAGNAVDLGGNGYPCLYTATAENLIPRIIENPPGARAVWVCGESDILTDKWAGTTVVDKDAAAQCRPDEWLVVVAFDES